MLTSDTYDAFGVEKNISDSDTNVFRYCGEYFDTETGTIYLRARYYNPGTGRFISRDSVTGDINDPLSLNLYTYCHNNPLLNFDPSGHWIIKDWYMKNIYEPMDDFGGKVYDFDVEYMDNWYTGLDELKHSNNTAVKSFGAWCEYYNNFSNDLYNTSKTGLKYCGAAISSLELNIKAGMGIGGKFEALEDIVDAEAIFTPMKENWAISVKGCKITNSTSASIGVSALGFGIRGYQDTIYNNDDIYNKGWAYAREVDVAYGFEATVLGADFGRDFASKTNSANLGYTIIDAEAYAIIGGGISLRFNFEKFYEKVQN